MDNLNTNNVNNNVDLETPAIMALSAASKTPFVTAFKITLGIGLARVLLFVVGTSSVLTVGTVLYKILNH